MQAILAILAAAAQLIPEVEAALPAIEALLSGQAVTTAQNAALWNAALALEAANAAKAAALQNQAT